MKLLSTNSVKFLLSWAVLPLFVTVASLGAAAETLETLATLSSFPEVDSLYVRSRSFSIDNPEHVVHLDFAAKQEYRYASLWHGEYLTAGEDPRSLIRFLTNQEFNFYKPYQMWYETTRKFATRKYTSKMYRCFFYESTGWWPTSDRSAQPESPWGEPVSLKAIFQHESCMLRDKKELIQGHFCHVVEIPNTVRLWVDANLNVVRQREDLIDAKRKLTDVDYSKTRVTHVLSGYRQVEDGIWLPMKIERKFYGSRPDTIHIIDEYQVNEFDTRVFRYAPRPGDIVSDRDTDRFYQVPGGIAHVDILADRAMSHANRSQQTLSKRRYRFLAVICSVSFLAGFVLWRLRDGYGFHKDC